MNTFFIISAIIWLYKNILVLNLKKNFLLNFFFIKKLFVPTLNYFYNWETLIKIFIIAVKDVAIQNPPHISRDQMFSYLVYPNWNIFERFTGNLVALGQIIYCLTEDHQVSNYCCCNKSRKKISYFLVFMIFYNFLNF